MAKKRSNARLVAQLIETPSRTMDKFKDPDGEIHGFGSPNGSIRSIEDNGIVRNGYPNFHDLGFVSQAFVDVTLLPDVRHEGVGDTNGEKTDQSVRERIQEIPGVILIYTVFGDVDLRCQVAATNLKGVEACAMTIRSDPGVEHTRTSIIVDETDYDAARKVWARLIRNNADMIDPLIESQLNGEDESEADFVDED